MRYGHAGYRLNIVAYANGFAADRDATARYQLHKSVVGLQASGLHLIFS
jgi:hypothetical protein